MKYGLSTALVTLVFSPLVFSDQPVEPLLQRYCLACHNQNEAQSGVSLQLPESIKKGGDNGPLIHPTDPKLGLLYQVMKPDSENPMPPVDEGQPTNAQRDVLLKWALAGGKIRPIATGIPDVPDIVPTTKVLRPTLSAIVQKGLIFSSGDRFIKATMPDGGVKWSTPSLVGKVASIELSADGQQLIAATGLAGVQGGVAIVDSETGTIVKKFGGHTDAAYSATMTVDGRLIASAGYDQRILLRDAGTGKVLQTLEGHNGSVFDLAFSPDGQVICSASADGTVKVWSCATGQRLDTMSQPLAEQYAVQVSPDGQRVYAAGADNRIRVWQLKSKDQPTINTQLVSKFAHEQAITQLTQSQSGQRIATAAEDGTLRIWNAVPMTLAASLPQQTQPITTIAFAAEHVLLVATLDGRIQLLKIPDQQSQPDANQVMTASSADAQPGGELQSVQETETNDTAQQPQKVTLPVRLTGTVSMPGDADCFSFDAKQGQQALIEVKAARNKSPLDSKVEVLTADGQPIVRTVLQAVRDSYFTFRGKDSSTSDDFRVFNWQEMTLNQYLYADGEVARLWLYPRGPDSGYKVYPGFGKRHTFFGTTASTHALNAPCFIVEPRSPHQKITPNGLPTFPIYFENDDDPEREIGADSRLMFTAPYDGTFVVRLTDARSFGGDDYAYELTVRSPQPRMTVRTNTKKITLEVGTGREIGFTANRIDGFNQPIMVTAKDLPEGFHFSGPIEIQAGQLRAFGTIFADESAVQPTAEQIHQIQFVAAADGQPPAKIGSLEQLTLKPDPKMLVRVARSFDELKTTAQGSVVLEVKAGSTIKAVLELDRLKHKGIVSFGKDDSGRNLPHGLYVDNIGLNGLLLLADQSRREFYITADKWVPSGTWTFYLKSNVDSITSFPVTIKVIAAEPADLTALAD